jgi:hypothetical protein
LVAIALTVPVGEAAEHGLRLSLDGGQDDRNSR